MYVVQIVLQQLSLTVFVTAHLLGVCSSEKKVHSLVFFEFFLKNTSRIFFFFFTFFARLTTTTTPEDELQPRSIKNVIENNFKVI